MLNFKFELPKGTLIVTGKTADECFELLSLSIEKFLNGRNSFYNFCPYTNVYLLWKQREETSRYTFNKPGYRFMKVG